LFEVLECAERGEPPVVGAADAALAHFAGIDPAIVFLALEFSSRRHEQARRASKTAMPRINPPCRLRAMIDKMSASAADLSLGATKGKSQNGSANSASVATAS
jgi:hypothetical protein